MRTIAPSLLGVPFISAAALQAEDIGQGHLPVTLTLIGGTQLTDSFSASNTNGFVSTQQYPGSSYSTHTPRWEVGVGGEFRLPFHNIRFEVDGLAKRLGYGNTTGTGANLAYRPTSATQWEIPGIFKFNFSLGHYRPFALWVLLTATYLPSAGTLIRMALGRWPPIMLRSW